MKDLPNELYDLISTYLKTQDIKSLRCASRALNATYSKHLLHETHLAFHQSSKQLREIALHPTIGQGVRHIFYSGATLEVFTRKPQNDETQEGVAVEWLDAQPVVNAVNLFPKLKSLVVSSGDYHRQHRTSNIEHEPVSGTNHDFYDKRPLTTFTLDSAAKLNEVRASFVDWKFFRSGHCLGNVTQAFSSLTTLELVLSLQDERGSDSLECGLLLSTGVIRRYLQRLPRLRRLWIGLQLPDNLFHIPLRNIIDKNTVWSDLRELTLESIEADEEAFLSLFGNHRSTLRSVGLWNPKLPVGMSWISLLPKLRQMLNLCSADPYGCFQTGLIGDDGFEFWALEELKEGEGVSLRQVLACWLTERECKEQCPLTKSNMEGVD